MRSVVTLALLSNKSFNINRRKIFNGEIKLNLESNEKNKRKKKKILFLIVKIS